MIPRYSLPEMDFIWQEDFKFAVSKLNKERIFTPEGKLFRFEEALAECE